MDYLPEGQDARDARKGLAKHGLTTLSDLSSIEHETWVLSVEIEWLRPLLPTYSNTFASPSLRIGQFWQRPRTLSKDSLLIHEVVSWDADSVLVYRWTHPNPRHTWSYIRDSDPVRLTFHDLFPTLPDAGSRHTRVSMVMKPNQRTKGTSDFPRVQAAPHTTPLVSTSSPNWKSWVHGHLADQEGYSPAFYTDGSYSEQSSIQSMIHPRDTVRESTAAVIIRITPSTGSTNLFSLCTCRMVLTLAPNRPSPWSTLHWLWL